MPIKIKFNFDPTQKSIFILADIVRLKYFNEKLINNRQLYNNSPHVPLHISQKWSIRINLKLKYWLSAQ